jgi:DNA polymerase V
MYLTKSRQAQLIVKQIFKPENKITRTLPVYITHNEIENENFSLEQQQPANLEDKLDLNGYLISHPSETFLVKVEGVAMKEVGVHPGDILIVDQSNQSRDERLVVGILNNKFTIKFLKVKGKQLFFASDSADIPDTEITPELGFDMWGVVTYIIHKPQLSKTSLPNKE